MIPKAISELEKDGFEGIDNSLAVSLFEYGLVWKHNVKDLSGYYAEQNNNSYVFVYKVGKSKFDWANIKDNCDPKVEFNWVNWNDVSNCNGMTVDEFLAQSLTQIVFDLFNYYGFENVFGTCYFGGFDISE